MTRHIILAAILTAGGCQTTASLRVEYAPAPGCSLGASLNLERSGS